MLNRYLPSLTAKELRVLSENDIKTAEAVLFLDAQQFCSRTHFSHQTLQNLIAAVSATHSAPYQLASNIWSECQDRMLCLSCGDPKIDELLQGGLYSGEITELLGPSACGKSMLCLTAAVFAACDPESYQRVVFIDTSGVCQVLRLAELYGHAVAADSRRAAVSLEAMLSRITVHRVFSLEQLLTTLFTLQSELDTATAASGAGGVLLRAANASASAATSASEAVSVPPVSRAKRRTALLVVDSPAACLSTVVGGKYIRGHSLLSQLANVLQTVAVEHSIAVLITNHTVTKIDSVTGERSSQAALGAVWTFVASTRLTFSPAPPTVSALGNTKAPSAAGSTDDGIQVPSSCGTITLSKSSKGMNGTRCVYALTAAGVCAR